MKKVSVLMPVYNGFPLLKASVESLLSQTYSNWECIIVNDGSTDNTRDYLETLTDKRFIIYQFDKNRGRPAARQKTLELASGDYIAMLDAEDLYDPYKIEKQVATLENNSELELVASGMCSFGTKTTIVTARGDSDGNIIIFNGKNFPCHATSMLRANKAKCLKYNSELKLGQDIDFLSRYLQKGSKYIVLPEILYYYSEYNSVSKNKIKQTYKLSIKKNWKAKNYTQLFVFLLKYCYAICFFPFIDIETILKRRGRMLSLLEHSKYAKVCKLVVDRCK